MRRREWNICTFSHSIVGSKGRFMDNLAGEEAAFSIGNVAEVGLRYGVKPGKWYGPSTMIQILEELNERYRPFSDLKVVAFPESMIYLDKLKESSSSPLIVLVSFRLGLKQINPEYFNAIIRIMALHNFMGIGGAQGDSALYFIGHQNKKLIYLDPHVTQKAVPDVESLWAKHLTYHCPSTLCLPMSQLRTNFFIGFYLRTKEDYELFVEEIGREAQLENSFVQVCEKKIDYELPDKNEETVGIGDCGKDEVFIIC
eukprot:TRINITY_DN3866_c0_g2_i5.p1 TRINITY_DN3866_c0_g2~~TRINITY_DN3866_c0_g2_i5.p1  ORF type:complete len:256 (+),score=61.76 TRINITY_DN3866_c0_g2_i5:653-1420(+)